jgi:hypothetical protein
MHQPKHAHRLVTMRRKAVLFAFIFGRKNQPVPPEPRPYTYTDLQRVMACRN